MTVSSEETSICLEVNLGPRHLNWNEISSDPNAQTSAQWPVSPRSSSNACRKYQGRMYRCRQWTRSETERERDGVLVEYLQSGISQHSCSYQSAAFQWLRCIRVVQALDRYETTKRACEDEGRWATRVKVDQKTICAHIFMVFWVEFWQSGCLYGAVIW